MSATAPKNNSVQSIPDRVWKRRKDTVQNENETFQDARQGDVVIAVMGKTGVGKSTFINTLLGTEVMKVGHDIVSCTSKLQWAIVDPHFVQTILPGFRERVIIVDTPGFDDTFQADSEILRRITAWLGSSYAKHTKLGGLIYLQNIAERRMEGASRRNLEMFVKLCGEGALSRVLLGTTSWEEVRAQAGADREKELKTKFWKSMIDEGSKVMRFKRTRESADMFVEHILKSYDLKKKREHDETVLAIQKEVVDMKKHIPQTAAGKELLYSIEEILEMHKKVQPEDDRDKEELRAKLAALENQMKALRLPFFTKLKSLFGL